jgi:hypothetical protein
MSVVAKDLEHHLSRELQALFGRHVQMAAMVLKPAELIELMQVAAANLACCSLSSSVASIAASTEGDVDVADLFDDFLTAYQGLLASQRDGMLEKISPAVAARKAQPA